MDKKIKRYYHTETITVPIGAGGSQLTYDVVFPVENLRCVGTLVYPHQAAFTIRIGLDQADTVIQQMTHPDDWISEPTVGYQDRMKPQEFGTKYKVVVKYQPLAVLGTAEVFDLVFVLE
jgi:hypothetical protein